MIPNLIKHGSTIRLHVLLGLIIFSVIQPLNAQIQITDSHGKYRFDEPPKRVVALNWTLVEQMLALGETPVGIANIAGFQKHSIRSEVPDDAVDVGQRLSPKLSTLRDLKPDVILIGYSQRSLLRPLSNIATVIYFKNFGRRYNNAEKSRERFLEMAKLFDKTELAEQQLAMIDSRLLEMRSQLADTYANKSLPTLQITIPQTKAEQEKRRPIWLFGNNSLPAYAAEALGLSVISPEETSQFGTVQLSPDQLNTLTTEQASSICSVSLSNYQTGSIANEAPKANGESADCAFEPAYQSAFGGVRSVLYLAEAMFEKLVDNANTKK